MSLFCDEGERNLAVAMGLMGCIFSNRYRRRWQSVRHRLKVYPAWLMVVPSTIFRARTSVLSQNTAGTRAPEKREGAADFSPNSVVRVTEESLTSSSPTLHTDIRVAVIHSFKSALAIVYGGFRPLLFTSCIYPSLQHPSHRTLHRTSLEARRSETPPSERLAPTSIYTAS